MAFNHNVSKNFKGSRNLNALPFSRVETGSRSASGRKRPIHSIISSPPLSNGASLISSYPAYKEVSSTVNLIESSRTKSDATNCTSLTERSSMFRHKCFDLARFEWESLSRSSSSSENIRSSLDFTSLILRDLRVLRGELSN